MHVKDMKDSVKVRPPGGNLFFVVLCVEVSGNYISFAPLDGLPLNLRHSPEVRSKKSSEALKVYVVCVTRVVSYLMASHTVWLRSSDFFPFSPRLRVVQTPAQANPSLM